MKTTIKLFCYTMLAILIFQGCQEEMEYTLKEYNPIGGITNADFTVTTNKYLDNTTRPVDLIFNVERLGGRTATFDLAVGGVEPASLANAFSLIATEITVSKKQDTLRVGSIDWSKLKPGETVAFTITCKPKSGTEVNYNGQDVNIEFTKAAAPVFELGNLEQSHLIAMGQAGNLQEAITLTLLDKPLEEDVDFALTLYPGGYTRGVHFDIDTLIHVAAGQTEGEVNLTVYGDQFGPGEQVEIYLEANEIPAGKAVTIGSSNWIGFIIGKAGDNIWLDKSKTYSALMDQNFEGNQKITLTIPMLSSPATQNIAMPLRLNQYYLQENTHFIIPDKVARVAKGEKSFKLDIYVVGSAFASGQSNKLWLEIHQEDVPAGQVLIVDNTYWWTTILIGRK